MTSGQTLLFMVLLAMVLLWFACVRLFSRHMRDRYPALYEEMRLAEIWPRNLAGWLAGHDNSRPAYATLRYLLRRDYLDLRDATLSALCEWMRLLLFVFLALFAALVYWTIADTGQDSGGTGLAQTSSPAQGMREKAFDLHRAGELAEAIAVYDELLRESNSDAELYYWRAMAYLKQQSSDLALSDFRRVMELQPTNFNAHLYADRILTQQKRWDDILEMWNGYLVWVPHDAAAYFERGGTNYRKGDLAAARADAARACELGKAEGCTWAERLKER